MGHVWHPIEPLPDDWESWADSELAAIRTVWADLRGEMGGDAAKRLHSRMLTEWSIETGMVEDLYRWDRGVTETLLTHGVRADRIPDNASPWSPELVAQVIHDQIEVAEGLFSFVKAERPLGTSFVHELHSQLLQSTPHDFELGTWKALPNRVKLQDGSVHEYCPPEHVAAEMDRLLELSGRYASAGVPVEIRAAWLHHRFTEIHPYPDGNGRTARALASLLLIQSGLFPLIIRRAEKDAYIDALESADKGNLQPLVERVRALQRREVVKMSAFLPVPPTETGDANNVESVIDQISKKLLHREQLIPFRWESLGIRVSELGQQAATAIDALARRLQERIGKRSSFAFRRVVPGQKQVEAIAEAQRESDYVPRLARFQSASALLLVSGTYQSHIVMTIHETGSKTNGLTACMVFLAQGDKLTNAGPDYFLITYAEPLPELKNRFGHWLDAKLLRGLDLWQQDL